MKRVLSAALEKWKQEEQGLTILLIDGSHRAGKGNLVELYNASRKKRGNSIGIR